MRIRKIIAVAGTLCFALSLTACGSSSSLKNDYSPAEAPAYYEEAAADYAYGSDSYYNNGVEMESVSMATGSYESGSSKGELTSENANTSNRKLIKRVSLNVETKEFDALVEGVSADIASLGGYIESMDGHYGSKYSSYRPERSANIVARVPSKQLDQFVKRVGEAGNITSKSESVEDITLSYVDLESHKKMLKEEQDRLMEFLERAETIEEIISIEDRLTSIRYQLDSMESQLRTYDNKIDYSTVTIYIDEVIDYTFVPEAELTPIERMRQGLAESWADLKRDLVDFGVNFVINLPYIIVFLIVVAILLLIVFLIVKASNRYARKHAKPDSDRSVFITAPKKLISRKEKASKKGKMSSTDIDDSNIASEEALPNTEGEGNE